MSTNLDLKEWLEQRLGTGFTFADFMQGARASRDMTQVQMAASMGLSKSTLCDIEKGRQLVSPALAAKIARKCQLSVKVAVQAALQDQVIKARLKMKVYIA